MAEMKVMIPNKKIWVQILCYIFNLSYHVHKRSI